MPTGSSERVQRSGWLWGVVSTVAMSSGQRDPVTLRDSPQLQPSGQGPLPPGARGNSSPIFHRTIPTEHRTQAPPPSTMWRREEPRPLNLRFRRESERAKGRSRGSLEAGSRSGYAWPSHSGTLGLKWKKNDTSRRQREAAVSNTV